MSEYVKYGMLPRAARHRDMQMHLIPYKNVCLFNDGRGIVVLACFERFGARCPGNITINYREYREESHNSQVSAECIIYARSEAPYDYVTTRRNKN